MQSNDKMHPKPKMFGAPPVYQPQHLAQAKLSAPPVYRPQTPLQARLPAPTVYRPFIPQIAQLNPGSSISIHRQLTHSVYVPPGSPPAVTMHRVAASAPIQRTQSNTIQLGKVKKARKYGTRTVANPPYPKQSTDALDEYLLGEGYSEAELEKEDRESLRVPTKDDPTVGGARQHGDSAALFKNIYNTPHAKRKTPWASEQDFHNGREAQHLIPACLAKHFSGLPSLIDSAENGMMLPAHARVKGKLGHRKLNNRDHARYTNNVELLLKAVVKLNNFGVNGATYREVMKVLRGINKSKGLSTYNVLDDIPKADFEKAWNQAHPPSDKVTL